MARAPRRSGCLRPVFKIIFLLGGRPSGPGNFYSNRGFISAGPLVGLVIPGGAGPPSTPHREGDSLLGGLLPLLCDLITVFTPSVEARKGDE